MTDLEKRGLYVAIEGGDGSGKGTQTKILVDKLRTQNRSIMQTSYPQYGHTSARYVERYLRGEYGAVNDIPPDLAALPFIIDRLQHDTLTSVREFLATSGNIVITDRSPASNLAHQATRITELDDRLQFYKEMMELEYETLAEPKPDLTIVLKVPADIAQENVDHKTERHDYTTAKRDIHEADANHLSLALRNYTELCQYFPDEFIAIDALDSHRQMRPETEVHADIMSLVQPHLV